MTRRLFLAAVGLAAVGLAAAAVPALAGWNGVAHVACNDCSPRSSYYEPRTSNYQHTTNYETESRFEPITVMKPEKYVEEVPVKVKSYYDEPVTTYSYRSYYDPCTGSCQKVAVPRTSYYRREECNTVMKYVEKVRMVPVQVEREVTYKRPIYTYYGPWTKTYGPITTPSVESERSPGVYRERGGGSGGSERIDPQNVPTTPMKMPVSGTKKVESKFNALSTSAAKASGASVRGEVVGRDQKTPLGGAKVVFVSAANLDERKYITADSFGGFDASLPAGDWILYVGPGDGKADYHSKVNVTEGDRRNFTVVSR